MSDRLERLEHIEEIRCLKVRYCRLCDTGYDAEKLGALFVDDGCWDGGDLGCFEGRERIQRFFSGMPKTMSMAVHHITNSAIELDSSGQRARGTWYLLQMATLTTDSQAVWLSGVYEDELVLEPDGWKFERITITTRFFSPYESGWAKTPALEL